MQIGIALSGGGARGVAHLGILKALEELQINLSVISGNSSGAIVGALYAYGYSPDEILKIILNTKLFKLIRFKVRLGLLKMDAAEKEILQYLPENNFSVLKKKLVIATTNLNSGSTVYFSEGELIKPLLASSSIPLVFAPAKIGDYLYLDGGLFNNLPVEALINQNRCDKIIAANCNPINKEFVAKGFKTLFERIFLLIMNASTFESRKYCDLLIEPPALSQFSTFKISKAQEMFDIGYQYTMALQPQLKVFQDHTLH